MRRGTHLHSKSHAITDGDSNQCTNQFTNKRSKQFAYGSTDYGSTDSQCV
jgi:hypothetical protein